MKQNTETAKSIFILLKMYEKIDDTRLNFLAFNKEKRKDIFFSQYLEYSRVHTLAIHIVDKRLTTRFCEVKRLENQQSQYSPYNFNMPRIGD